MGALFLDDLPIIDLPVVDRDVEVVVGEIAVFDAAMTPGERATYRGARRADFSSGRRVARCALERVGFEPVVGRDDRRPVWPPGAVGSITHAAGIALAAVARADAYDGIGVDLEAVDAVSARVATRIGTPMEQPTCADGAALLFSAKESIYKAVNPLVGEYLPFRAVSVSWDLADRTFHARTVVDRPSSGRIAAGTGRFQRMDDCWLTVFTIAHETRNRRREQ